MLISRSEEKGTGSGFYSPLVLSIAQKENVSFDELKSINGTGLEGRVTKKDILNYIEKRKIARSSEFKIKFKIKRMEKLPHEQLHLFHQLLKLFIMLLMLKKFQWITSARELWITWCTAVIHQFMLQSLIEVDMTRIHNFISANKDEIMKNENAKITYMAFIADAVVKSLKKYPLVNSSIDGNTILQKKFINLGIAVAIEPTGLIVPNIKGAGDRNVIGSSKSNC